jgi:hypothetical protein
MSNVYHYPPLTDRDSRQNRHTIATAPCAQAIKHRGRNGRTSAAEDRPQSTRRCRDSGTTDRKSINESFRKSLPIPDWQVFRTRNADLAKWLHLAQIGSLFAVFERPHLSPSARTARVCRQVLLASVLLSLRERNCPLAEREEYTDPARRSERAFRRRPS